MAALARLQLLREIRKTVSLAAVRRQPVRSIATSPKKDENTLEPMCPPPKKNWVSYGFDFSDKTDDRNALHSSYFFSITLCIVVGGLFLAYMPDTLLRDWAQREAYLELRRREQLGLPPVDRNYVDPRKISLPSDEELGSMEIII